MPRSRIQTLTAVFALLISVQESDIISGGLLRVHCSSIESIVYVVVEKGLENSGDGGDVGDKW